MVRTRADELLLGEWACLGVLARGPAHGYDVASRLAPEGVVGRVWSLSRPLTYRALDQLTQRGLVEQIGEERGRAGGNRTILAATGQGHSLLLWWLQQPVPHFREVRNELLVKLVLCDLAGVDTVPLLEAQRAHFVPMVEALRVAGGPRRRPADPVAVWRYESSRSVLRFIDRVLTEHPARADQTSPIGD
jgi:PadR family transcriptional regulator AphA